MTDAETNTVATDSKLARSLKDQLAFQRRWQRLSMLAYVLSTVGILVCSTLGGLAAAKQLNDLAASLAAATTILVGFEKSMLFREKWKFHLAIATRLSVLSTQMDAGLTDTSKVVDEYTSALRAYADSLPIADRDGGQ